MSQADTLDEFRKSFSDGWFGIKINGKVYPAVIDQNKIGETDRGVLPVKYIPIKTTQSTLSAEIKWDTERDRLLRAYPSLGCVKAGQTVGYLRVRPLRQYQKGYVYSNADLYVPNLSQIKKFFPRQSTSTGSREIVWQLWNREYWHPMAAVELMDSGEGVGYPLSQNFGLYCNSELPHLIIMHKNHDVGAYKDGQFELFNKFGLLKEQFTRETTVACKVGT
jgi:hypothetical protein